MVPFLALCITWFYEQDVTTFEGNMIRSQGGHSVVKIRGGGGGLLNSLGSGILVGKKYFGVLQKC